MNSKVAKVWRGTPEMLNITGPWQVPSNRADISLSTVSPGSAVNSTGWAFKVKSIRGGGVGSGVGEAVGSGVGVAVGGLVDVVVGPSPPMVVVVEGIVVVVVKGIVVVVVGPSSPMVVVVGPSSPIVVVVGPSSPMVVVVELSSPMVVVVVPDKLPGKTKYITINKEYTLITVSTLNLNFFFMAKLLRLVCATGANR